MNKTFSEMQIDAIGEVMNISMGAAATAVSTMLDKKAVITTPQVQQKKLKDIDYSDLDPAILVKITYVQGIEGSNVMVFKQTDMQLILNQLMGIEEPPSEDYEFDELGISAACEVMNQMMGASATALSNFLGKSINISTPTAEIIKSSETFTNAVGMDTETYVISIIFDLDIEGIMKSEFVAVISRDLALEITNQLGVDVEGSGNFDSQAANSVADTAPSTANQLNQNEVASLFAAQGQQQQGYPPQQTQQDSAQYPGYPPQQQQQQQQQYPGYPPQQQQQQYPGYPPQQQYPGYPPQQQQYPGYPPQQYPGYPAPGVQNAKLPQFNPNQHVASIGGNMDLIMNVPLGISIEIGKTKKKIKEILEFAQGTVLELDKQAGAPVDIVVNGQLIAKGDVVVIDDNFGVRITEIVNTAEILEIYNSTK